jgi:inhibitor of cysteine peptidase
VTLESNRTTGYSWQVAEIDPTVLAQQGEAVYVQPPASTPGQGGSETFLFTAEDTGETTLQFAYQRPGETDVTPTPEQLYTLNIVVEEGEAMETSSDLTGLLTGAVTYRQRFHGMHH